ncbi:2-dehydropantoate 2-reductase [Polynucleobacter sp. 31A-FELB]|uniref:ketopantoate reductase family protein n=1 Tax=Polynucleobacter sp. 31A-FELB TaxID=2689096 RepID=UPI001C0D6A52|nr:2-dehydropantoate 2-reductase [Polynucleobacter sp. 31A-FELB]MBU3587203.1 2-dehydropantoate 2-reductase [Polynucleobacter sp. 31A-FELB]
MKLRKFKKIYVLGAGAVGCFFGGMLARSNKDTTLIARPERANAISADGLEMQCQKFQEIVSINVSHDLSALTDADLVLLCVKSPDTENTMKQVSSIIPKEAVILSLQNGVANVEIASSITNNPVYPAVVYVACGMHGQRVLKHHGRGELLVGSINAISPHELESLREICTLFESAAVPCEIAPQILKDMWLKFLVNCSYNAISGIGQIAYGEMVKVPEIVKLINGITEEFLQIAAQKGLHIERHEAMAANDAIAKTMSTQISSTAQDLRRGKKSEIDYLNGYIVKLGKEYEIPTPLNESVYAMIKMLESRMPI